MIKFCFPYISKWPWDSCGTLFLHIYAELKILSIQLISHNFSIINYPLNPYVLFLLLTTTYLKISGVFDTCWISSFSSYFLLNQFYWDIYTAIPLKLLLSKSPMITPYLNIVEDYYWSFYSSLDFRGSFSCSDTPLACEMKVKVAQSCPTLCDPMDYTEYCIFWGQNTGVGSLSLPTGIKPRSPTLQADSLPAEPEGVTTKYICSARILWIHVTSYPAYISTQINNWVPKASQSSTSNVFW